MSSYKVKGTTNSLTPSLPPLPPSLLSPPLPLLTFSASIPERTLRSSCICPPTPSSRPMCTHSVRMYVPASQLTQNTAEV